MTEKTPFTSLEGKLLLAMPGMGDPRFVKSVIFMCTHTAEGAMGLAINQPLGHLSFSQLLQQLSIEAPARDDIRIHAGGPVETGRGFVLHSPDYAQDTTLFINNGTVGLSATVDILKALARGNGPRNHLLALGYAGWGKGQLEFEIARNSWLTVDATDQLIFVVPAEEKWPRAMAEIGVDVSKLSAAAGHA
ncbi:MAG TPA: YqgE/AlgH family protein [Sphingomonadales bacterium]|nr:YqgE/AlgH family protein [Sphingomonadales bacterium]